MSDAAQKPLLAITLGDPAGVGPEVVVRAWSDPRVHECCRPVALGHPEILRRAVELTGSSARVEVLDSLSTVAQLGLDRRPNGIRLVRASRLPQRRDVIDVDSQFNHGTGRV